MRSKLLFSVAAVLCVSALWVSPTQATWVPMGVAKPKGPTWAIDIGRSIEGIIEGVLALSSDGESKAELIAVQEAINANADGTTDDSPNTTVTSSETTGTAAPTAFTNGVYNYVQSEILSQTDITQYSVLQQDLSSPKAEGNAQATCESLGFTSDRPKKTCIAIVDTFFADKGDENTEEYVQQILSQRREYGKQTAERHVTLGYNVQQNVIPDLNAAAQAPVTSDNEIGAIAIDGQTLDEMLKVTVADLALQIEMMEADAVDFLLQQPVEMMPRERPTEVEKENSEATPERTGDESGSGVASAGIPPLGITGFVTSMTVGGTSTGTSTEGEDSTSENGKSESETASIDQAREKQYQKFLSAK